MRFADSWINFILMRISIFVQCVLAKFHFHVVLVSRANHYNVNIIYYAFIVNSIQL